MAVDAALLDRAGELKQALVEFADQPQYDRAFTELVARHSDESTLLDEQRAMTLADYFVLQHRLRNGRTVLEQFVAAHRELSPREREMVLGWREVVEGPFEVQRRQGQALIVLNLVDDLTYRVHSNMGPSVFRQMPSRSFLITRLVPIGDAWMISGPAQVLLPTGRDAVLRIAAEMALLPGDRVPESGQARPSVEDAARGPAAVHAVLRYGPAGHTGRPGAFADGRVSDLQPRRDRT